VGLYDIRAREDADGCRYRGNSRCGLALALGILIVILMAAGSIWIMADLNEKMMPPPELMNLHMQH